MRIRHLALATVLLLSLSGCDAVLATAHGTVIDQKDLASNAAATMAVSTAKMAVVAYLAVNPDQLPTAAELGPYGFQPTEGVTLAVVGSAADFCVQATSESGSIYHARATGAVEDGACA